MKTKLLGLLVLVSLLGLSPAEAMTYTYDVDYAINSTTVTGDIVLNCDLCDVTSSTLVSWSLSSSGVGTSATFDGSDLSASASSITFTPTTSASSMFIEGSADSYFGANGSVSGGSGSSCLVSGPPGTNLSEAYGVCSNGVLTPADTTTSLIIATADFMATPVPAALPLFAGGLGALGLFGWRERRKNAATASSFLVKTKLFGLLACTVLLGVTNAASASPYIVTLEQVGSNVIATGSGNIDLTGLTVEEEDSVNNIGVSDPRVPLIAVGFSSNSTIYSGSFSEPSSFGTGNIAVDNSSSGSWVSAGYEDIGVPLGYTSDSALGISTSTYDNATFASLGVTPGIYVWIWGAGADQSVTLEIGATPLPTALPLFASGLGALALFGWRRRRKSAASDTAVLSGLSHDNEITGPVGLRVVAAFDPSLKLAFERIASILAQSANSLAQHQWLLRTAWPHTAGPRGITSHHPMWNTCACSVLTWLVLGSSGSGTLSMAAACKSA